MRLRLVVDPTAGFKLLKSMIDLEFRVLVFRFAVADFNFGFPHLVAGNLQTDLFGLGDLYKVVYGLDHPTHRGVVLLDDRVVHLAKTQRVKCLFLLFGCADAAAYLGYLYFCHFLLALRSRVSCSRFFSLLTLNLV